MLISLKWLHNINTDQHMMIKTFLKWAKSFFIALRAFIHYFSPSWLLSLSSSLSRPHTQTHTTNWVIGHVWKLIQGKNNCILETWAMYGVCSVGLDSVGTSVLSFNNRGQERRSKLLTALIKAVKNNFFMVKTCMNRPQMNTVSRWLDH